MDGNGPDTNDESGRSGTIAVATDARQADADKRRETRRRKERDRKARLIAQRKDRLEKERMVLQVAASGASLADIAREVGLSKERVRQIYHSGMARLEAENIVEYRQAAMHSLGVLKRRAFSGAFTGDVGMMREARHIQDQMNRLQGAYPPLGVDLTGVVVHQHDSMSRVATALEAIRSQRQRQSSLAIEAEAVESEPVTTRRPRMAELNGVNGNSPNGDHPETVNTEP